MNSRKTILVTGFEAYGDRSGNPSADLAIELNGQTIDGFKVTGAVFPVVNRELPMLFSKQVQAVAPSAIVALGLCPGEGMIRLERLAANYAAFEIPDNAGQRVCGPIIEEAPAAYEATLPLPQALSSLIAAGIPARVSNTAGTFLCNALMYRALHYCATELPDCRCGFVHLPFMPSQVCDLISRGESVIDPHHQNAIASMPLTMQREAIRLVIQCIALELERERQ